MDKDLKESRIQKFIDDESTQQAVYSVIKDTFLAKKGQKDIQILAAERIAVDLLDDAWKELKKYKTIQDGENNAKIGYV